MTTQPPQAPYRVAIVGAGRVGLALAAKLAPLPEFSVTLADGGEHAVDAAGRLGFACRQIDALDAPALERVLTRHDAVVAALPSGSCPAVAAAAARLGLHYLDLVEDAGVAARIMATARAARSTFVPQCGLSPGLVSTLALHLLDRTPGASELHVRVGVLPRHPTNRLGYGLTWNVHGLVAEYTGPASVLIDGRAMELPALSGHESVRIDGVAYEAFVTGGVFSSLRDRVAGRVKTFVPKTIRYPGHLELIRFLLDDLRLRERPNILHNLLQNGLPEIEDDEILLFMSARGTGAHGAVERHFVRRLASSPGSAYGAMQEATSSHVAAVLDLLRERRLPAAGLVEQEDLPADALLGNRFLNWLAVGGS